MRIIHLADIHIGATSDALLEAARAAIIAQGAAALAVSGDLTQRGSKEEFRRAREWIDSLDLPAITVPGNHDTPLLGARHRLLKPFARYGAFFGDLTRPLDAGSARLFPLNTARGWQARANWAEGVINLPQLEEAIAAAGEAGAIPVLVCHHPLTPHAGAGLRTRTHRGERASLRLSESPFRLVLTGHVHTPLATRIETEAGNYIAISAGTLSHRLRNAPPGFNLVEADERGVTAMPFAFKDGVFAAMPTHRYAWDLEPRPSGHVESRHDAGPAMARQPGRTGPR